MRIGLPHSDIPGSKLVLSSPGLFAEYHVLLRLSLPRHPPDALLFLILTMRMCDLTAHTVCKLLLPTNFHVLLELFRLILILAINF